MAVKHPTVEAVFLGSIVVRRAIKSGNSPNCCIILVDDIWFSSHPSQFHKKKNALYSHLSKVCCRSADELGNAAATPMGVIHQVGNHTCFFGSAYLPWDLVRLFKVSTSGMI